MRRRRVVPLWQRMEIVGYHRRRLVRASDLPHIDHCAALRQHGSPNHASVPPGRCSITNWQPCMPAGHGSRAQDRLQATHSHGGTRGLPGTTVPSPRLEPRAPIAAARRPCAGNGCPERSTHSPHGTCVTPAQNPAWRGPGTSALANREPARSLQSSGVKLHRITHRGVVTGVPPPVNHTTPLDHFTTHPPAHRTARSAMSLDGHLAALVSRGKHTTATSVIPPPGIHTRGGIPSRSPHRSAHPHRATGNREHPPAPRASPYSARTPPGRDMEGQYVPETLR
jgi:hypothetical protein